jgi:hypothetical protein
VVPGLTDPASLRGAVELSLREGPLTVFTMDEGGYAEVCLVAEADDRLRGQGNLRVQNQSRDKTVEIVGFRLRDAHNVEIGHTWGSSSPTDFPPAMGVGFALPPTLEEAGPEIMGAWENRGEAIGMRIPPGEYALFTVGLSQIDKSKPARYEGTDVLYRVDGVEYAGHHRTRYLFTVLGKDECEPYPGSEE